MHDLAILGTLAGALGFALLLGWITERLGLSILVGYLLAGIAADRTRRALLPMPISRRKWPKSAWYC